MTIATPSRRWATNRFSRKTSVVNEPPSRCGRRTFREHAERRPGEGGDHTDDTLSARLRDGDESSDAAPEARSDPRLASPGADMNRPEIILAPGPTPIPP